MNGYTNQEIEYSVTFPATKAGLTTIGYQFKSGGENIGNRVTAGVFENGNGSYGTKHTHSAAFSGIIIWDTGDSDIKRASEDVNIITAATGGDPLLTVIEGSDPPMTRGEAIDKLYVPEYVGPIVTIPAPPTPELQRLSGSVKQLGISWAVGDKLTLTPNVKQISNSSLLSNTPLIITVDSDGNIIDPTDGLLGVLVDKGMTIRVECSHSGNPPYYAKTIIITTADTKDLSTY